MRAHRDGADEARVVYKPAAPYKELSQRSPRACSGTPRPLCWTCCREVVTAGLSREGPSRMMIESRTVPGNLQFVLGSSRL